MRLKSGSFEEMARDIIEYHRKIVLFGAGVIGTVTVPEILHSYHLDSFVECYLDNDIKRWGNEIEGKYYKRHIYSPEHLREMDDKTVILLNISRYSDALCQLESLDCTERMSCYIMPMMFILNFRKNHFCGVVRESRVPLIPKKIHYMWLGGKPIPGNLQKCIDSWKHHCPDYEILRWDETNYDIEKNLYMKQAYEAGAYGFVPDYARIDILYHFGGIYMDTDVEVIKCLDDLLYQQAFCGVEKWQIINFGGCSGSIKGHRSLASFIQARESLRFLKPDGSFNKNTCGFYDTRVALNNGYQLNGTNQKILEMNIYTSDYFHPYDYMSGRTDKTEDTFTIHHFNGGWLDETLKAANEKTSRDFEALYKRTLNKPLISVIIPIYNVREYLETCLDSVCKQTFKNIQIILVDDGSTDDSAILCDEYAKLYAHIQVLHKANGGLVSTRKAGVELATGEYITFVDGDDWLDRNAFEALYEYIIINNYPDVLSFGCVEEHTTHKAYLYNAIPEKLYLDESLSELKRNILMGETFFEWRVLPHLCDKLIKREIIEEKIKNMADIISFGEDAACSFSCMLKANSILSVNYAPYHYRQREGSIVKSKGELEPGNFKEIYSSIKDSIGTAGGLNKQLHYYMFFILLLKSYSRIGSKMPLFPFEKVCDNSRVFIYGAGGFGKVIVDYIAKSECLWLSGWTDKRAASYRELGLNVDLYDTLFQREFDYVVIAILNEKIAYNIKVELVKLGIPEEKIDYVRKEVLNVQRLPEWLNA